MAVEVRIFRSAIALANESQRKSNEASDYNVWFSQVSASETSRTCCLWVAALVIHWNLAGIVRIVVNCRWFGINKTMVLWEAGTHREKLSWVRTEKYHHEIPQWHCSYCIPSWAFSSILRWRFELHLCWQLPRLPKVGKLYGSTLQRWISMHNSWLLCCISCKDSKHKRRKMKHAPKKNISIVP